MRQRLRCRGGVECPLGFDGLDERVLRSVQDQQRALATPQLRARVEVGEELGRRCTPERTAHHDDARGAGPNEVLDERGRILERTTKRRRAGAQAVPAQVKHRTIDDDSSIRSAVRRSACRRTWKEQTLVEFRRRTVTPSGDPTRRTSAGLACRPASG